MEQLSASAAKKTVHNSFVHGNAARSSKLSEEDDDVCASNTDVITLLITSTYVIDAIGKMDVIEGSVISESVPVKLVWCP